MSTRGTVTILGPEERQKIATWAKNVEVGTVVTFRKKSRSSEQSAKMWAMLHEIADQVEWYGAKLEAEDWKDMATASLRHARVVPGIDRGTYVPLGMHTSTMTIEEMTNLIEFLYAFGAEHGVVFKDPKENSDSGSPPPSDPDTADGPTSAEAGDPSPQLPASTSSADRKLLIECCAKFMALTKEDPNVDAPTRRGILETAKNNWKAAVRPDLHPQIASFFLSADGIITGKQTNREGAIREFAHVLDCDPSEIGG